MQTGSITREAGAVIPSRTLAACAGFKPSITVSLTAFIARKDVQEQGNFLQISTTVLLSSLKLPVNSTWKEK